ncbi:DUF2798 domain-containing protein [Flavobacterium sp. LB2R40]|uniref:DUF2798 domain-containing protein n=1 Tax=unclassified Flavobacterium TaxID=196869 RepID=UPI003AAFA244
MKVIHIKASLLTTFIVTSYISFTLVAVNVGFTDGFVFIWLRSWLIAFFLATPSLLIVGPFIRKKLNCEN